MLDHEVDDAQVSKPVNHQGLQLNQIECVPSILLSTLFYLYVHLWSIYVHFCASINSFLVYFLVSTGYLFPGSNHQSRSSSI